MPEPGFDGLAERVNGDPSLVRRGRFLDTEFVLADGAREYWIAVRRGRIAEIRRGAALMRSWHFKIAANAEAWREFWRPEPKPGFHDLFAMCKAGKARIEGDLRPLMANLRYFKDVLAAPRAAAGNCDAA